MPGANLNGVRCTAGFMDEIVENQEKYIGLPLCADTVNLVKGRYKKLGHCYDPKTGVYSSSIIGSFYRFEKEELDDGEVALVGYARVMKRNKRVCKAIGELFADGALKFSFEISCGTYEVLEDDTILIDAADNNFIEGMCIVSFPACPEAVALELVAEINGIGKEADEMIDVIESAEVTTSVAVVELAADEVTAPSVENGEPETVVAEVAEETSVESEEVIAETEASDVPAEDEDVSAEAEVVAEESVDENAEAQNAELHVVTETSTRETVDIFDSETGTSVTEVTIHEVRTHERIEDAELVVEIAEVEVAAEEVSNDAVAEAAKESTPDYAQVIAELRDAMEALRNELKEIRQERFAAEAKANAGEMLNPFVAEISAPKKYSLLESEKTSSTGYSLLEKA